jgi:glycosyltransferase 2 family protein
MSNRTLSDATPQGASAWRRMLVYGVTLVFLIWCALAFRRDIAQIDLAPLKDGWSAVLFAGLLSLANYVLRVVRWQMYLRRLGHDLPWRFVTLTFMAGFAFTLSPGKLGEMVRARYYQPKGIPLSQVSGAFFVERLLDLLVMILLAVVVLADLQDYRSFLWVAVGLVVGLLAGIVLVPWGQVAVALQQRQMTGAPGTLLKAASGVARMFDSAQVFLSPGLLASGLLLGLVAWGAEAVGLKLVADVLMPDQLSYAGAMGCYAIAIVVGALSFLPGGLGSTEAVMAGLLVARGFAKPQAILLTLICRLLTLWLAVLIGWLSVWRLKHEN